MKKKTAKKKAKPVVRPTKLRQWAWKMPNGKLRRGTFTGTRSRMFAWAKFFGRPDNGKPVKVTVRYSVTEGW